MSVTVISGQTYDVSSGQTDTGDTVLSGGTEYVQTGGSTISATVDPGGTLERWKWPPVVPRARRWWEESTVTVPG
jgi:autotransporter passenger strand-loop-strand repeat protein